MDTGRNYWNRWGFVTAHRCALPRIDAHKPIPPSQINTGQ